MTDNSRLLPLPALLLGAVAIGFAPVLVRLSELGPIATAFYRMSMALPVLILLELVAARRGVAGAAAPATGSGPGLVLAGLLFAADLAVWHWSIQLTSVANATLLANFAPVLVALASWLLLRERPRRWSLAALAVGTVGVGLLVGDSLGLDATHVRGDALGLATAFFYAAYIVLVGRLRRRYSTVRVMTVSSLTASLVLLPLAYWTEDQMLAASTAGWLILAALAIGSHVLGQGLVAYALAHLPATFASVALLIQPLVAAALGWWLLAEAMRGLQLIGAAAVLAAVVMAHRGLGVRRPDPRRGR